MNQANLLMQKKGFIGFEFRYFENLYQEFSDSKKERMIGMLEGIINNKEEFNKISNYDLVNYLLSVEEDNMFENNYMEEVRSFFEELPEKESIEFLETLIEIKEEKLLQWYSNPRKGIIRRDIRSCGKYLIKPSLLCDPETGEKKILAYHATIGACASEISRVGINLDEDGNQVVKEGAFFAPYEPDETWGDDYYFNRVYSRLFYAIFNDLIDSENKDELANDSKKLKAAVSRLALKNISKALRDSSPEARWAPLDIEEYPELMPGMVEALIPYSLVANFRKGQIVNNDGVELEPEDRTGECQFKGYEVRVMSLRPEYFLYAGSYEFERYDDQLKHDKQIGLTLSQMISLFDNVDFKRPYNDKTYEARECLNWECVDSQNTGFETEKEKKAFLEKQRNHLIFMANCKGWTTGKNNLKEKYNVEYC